MSDLTRRAFLTKSLRYTAAGISGMALQAGCGGSSGTVDGGIPASELLAMRGVALGFMNKYKIPGLSIAIARNDKLVYAYGFGVADQATGEAVSPNHLFRIASTSKPITAVTIIRLINTGMLHRTDKVFGEGRLLGDKYAPYVASTSDWVRSITVEQLLWHTAGGWFEINSDPNFTDPMWQHLSLSQQELIAYTMQNVPLQYPPGTYYGYSNFGYCLLGRIIEKVTGRTYSEAAYQHALTSCGISDMQIGTDTRLPNEVMYYVEQGDGPAANKVPISRLDSAGGWLATAPELVHFLMRVDEDTVAPDIVPAQGSTINISDMITAASGTRNADSYGLGWIVDSAMQWLHDGSQPGVRSCMQRSVDSAGNVFCWAVLTNTRHLNTQVYGVPEFQSMVTAMINQVSAWRS